MSRNDWSNNTSGGDMLASLERFRRAVMGGPVPLVPLCVVHGMRADACPACAMALVDASVVAWGAVPGRLVRP